MILSGDGLSASITISDSFFDITIKVIYFTSSIIINTFLIRKNIPELKKSIINKKV